MPYNFTNTDGTVTFNIIDGALNQSSTALSLPGPNYAGYGEFLDINLVALLENFAKTTPPTQPSLYGQLWFDKGNQTLKVYTTDGYVTVGGTTAVAAVTPTLTRTGDSWFNTTTNQLSVYDGTAYQLVGPIYTKTQGISGAIPVQVSDGTNQHNILELKYGTQTYAIVSGDPAFTPSVGISGFAQINPGITFNSGIPATINSNLVGNVTGNVVGNLTGAVVTATNVYGNLTGNVTGNLTGAVVTATNVYGNLTGNATSYCIVATNFSSGNAVITGGSITGDTSGTFTTLQATNFSSGNAVITGGSITGDTSGTFTTLQATNFSSGNAQITGGSATGLTAVSVTTSTATNSTITTEVATNFSSANAQITGGNVTGIVRTSATTAQFANISTGNAVITGGQIAGVSFVVGTQGTFNNFSTANALITGGNVSGVVGVNNTFTSAQLTNSTATTESYSDNSTNVATTAFVQNVLPLGVIVMWGGTTLNIPAGWQLCDGSNGTPDLRNQFIVGAGSSYNPGASGGASSVTLANVNIPSHNHTVSIIGTTGSAGGHTHTASSSVSDPGHHHEDPYAEGGVPFPQVPNTWGAAGSAATDGDQTRYYTGMATTGIAVSTSLSQATDHQHAVNISSTTGLYGNNQPFNIIPPYYALCYIQKMF